MLPSQIVPLPDFRSAFIRHYATIRRFVEERDLGIALVAVRPDGMLGGRAWVSAKVDQLQTAIVGRHSSVDLYLEADESLSNRHLAVVIEPVASWSADELRFRLLDLRTGSAMTTESGERVEAIIAEGPAFVRIGATHLMAFQTGELSWPDDPEEAWDALPPRVFVDEREAEPDQWKRLAMQSKARGKITLLPGALDGNDPRGGQPLGRLAMRSLQGNIERTITRNEAAQGILLGREPRCDFSGLLAIAEVSRVHLMIARIGGRTWAIDTGSMAGLRLDGATVRCIELDRARTFSLGERLAELTWTPYVLH